MKRVVFFMQNLKFGGAEKVLVTFLQNFDRSRLDVTLVLHTKEGQLLTSVPPDVKVIGLVPRDNGRLLNKAGRAAFLRLLFYLPGLIKRYVNLLVGKRDLDIAFLEGITTKITSLSTVPKIAWVHTDLLNNSWTDPFFKNSIDQSESYRSFDKIVFVSSGGRKSFHVRFPEVDKSKFLIIHNPIDFNAIREGATLTDLEFIDWLSNTDGTFRIITVGRLDKVKRVQTQVNAFKILSEEYSGKFSLTIVGDGPELGYLQSLCTDDDGVFFVGFKSNPYSYVKNSSLLISTSKVESYPTSVIESMVVGTPVLATKNQGTEEIFGGQSGNVIAEDVSPCDLAAIVAQLRSNPEKLTKLRSFSLNGFGLRAKMESYYRLFSEVTNINEYED